jgi:hypothetical protein
VAHAFLLPFAAVGFAIAQPVYNLLLQTPVFLVARQNAAIDVWVLVLVLSLLLPLCIAIPAWLTHKKHPSFASWWCWIGSSSVLSLFFAQIFQQSLGGQWLLFCIGAILAGGLAGWILMFTRWSLMTSVLSLFSAIFPLWFLLFSPALDNIQSHAAAETTRNDPLQALPDIVFIILDELPLATLLDENRQVDANLFPGFARLQSMSDWYFNTTSVSDGTVDAVPSILTGNYPKPVASELTVAAQPINLFTLLRRHYRFNVAEAVTRLCPQTLCPRTGFSTTTRIKALLLDLAAIYLHRVSPDVWSIRLPNVTDNWSGFFAERQVFFPDGWLKHAGAQTVIDRPAYFQAFIQSIVNAPSPVLNFLHILFPHGPLAYLPNGENYGHQWMRGLLAEQWSDSEWSVLSGKQRHFLQVQYADSLLNQLLDHLQQQEILDDSMIVLVADHGANFETNAPRRALSSNNSAAMLRIPLFIKNPGQQSPREVLQPAMTIDIVPTMLSTLGFTSEEFKTDGIDLTQSDARVARDRYSNSYLTRELQRLDEAELDLGPLVEKNRKQLKLGASGDQLWNIGPFDDARGVHVGKICQSLNAGLTINIEGFSKLPGDANSQSIPAFIAGSIQGHETTSTSVPFIISNNDLVVASGHTWEFNGGPLFFALVEPRLVKQSAWRPKVWLVKEGECFSD